MIFNEAELLRVIDERIDAKIGDKPPPPEDWHLKTSGTVLHHFRRGDIDAAKLEAAVVNLSTERRPGSSFRFDLPRGGTLSSAGATGRGYISPIINSDGDLFAERTEGQADKHVMFNVRQSDYPAGIYLPLDVIYRIAFWVRPDFASWEEVDGVPVWAIPAQVWGPMYPANARWSNPPLHVRQLKGQLEVGMKTGHPVNDAGQVAMAAAIPFDDADWHLFDITYRPSHTNGILDVKIDGVEYVKLTGQTALTHNDQSGGMLAYGCYSGSTGTAFSFREMLVERL